MKKGQILKLTQLLFVLSILQGCDKKEVKKPEQQIVNTEIKRGLPENPKKINGYLYAGNSRYLNGGSGYSQVSVNAFFGDPARNFLSVFDHHNEQMMFFNNDNTSNVSVGTLSYNDNILGGQNTTFYTRTFTIQDGTSSENAHWVSTGNKSFLPMDITVPGGFPNINLSAVAGYSVVSRNKEFVVNFSNFISNCDSVAVTFGNQGTLGYLRKAAKFSDGEIRFSKEEIYTISSVFSTIVQYTGYNYSNKTTNNKVFVFELGNRIRLYTVFAD